MAQGKHTHQAEGQERGAMCCGVRGIAAGRRPQDDPAPWRGGLVARAARWTPTLPARTQLRAHVTALEMESPVPYDAVKGLPTSQKHRLF